MAETCLHPKPYLSANCRFCSLFRFPRWYCTVLYVMDQPGVTSDWFLLAVIATGKFCRSGSALIFFRFL